MFRQNDMNCLCSDRMACYKVLYECCHTLCSKCMMKLCMYRGNVGFDCCEIYMIVLNGVVDGVIFWNVIVSSLKGISGICYFFGRYL